MCHTQAEKNDLFEIVWNVIDDVHTRKTSVINASYTVIKNFLMLNEILV